MVASIHTPVLIVIARLYDNIVDGWEAQLLFRFVGGKLFNPKPV